MMAEQDLVSEFTLDYDSSAETDTEPPSKRSRTDFDLSSEEYPNLKISFPETSSSPEPLVEAEIVEGVPLANPEQADTVNGEPATILIEEEEDDEDDEETKEDEVSSDTGDSQSEETGEEDDDEELGDAVEPTVDGPEEHPISSPSSTPLENIDNLDEVVKLKPLSAKKQKSKHRTSSKPSSSRSVTKAMKNASKNKAANLRKNIKDILKTEHLGKETLAAQREEAERRQRTNLKLQQLQQQQQLKLLHQQQAQLMRENEWDSGENAYSKLSIEDIVSKISQKKQITLSLDADDGKGKVNLKKPSQGSRLCEDEIVLSSDEEGDNDHVTTSNLRSRAFQFPSNHLLKPYDPSIIAISSEDEDHNREDRCDKEVQSFEQVLSSQGHRNQVPAADSDDDCVVISPTPEDDDADKDERNQDEINVPDEIGRVLVNVGHPEEDPDIFLAPQICRIVKPHQIGGIRFLYDNVVESVDRFNTTSGFGCILAHSMGLGKTLQAVSFCDVFLRASKSRTILVIVPINTIQNWLNEFNVWLPPTQPSSSTLLETKKRGRSGKSNLGQKFGNHSQSQSDSIDDAVKETVSLNLSFDSTLNLSIPSDDSLEKNKTEDDFLPKPEDSSDTEPEEIGEVHLRSFGVFVLNETVKTLNSREKIIADWSNQGGVLLIGYEMYRMLALKKLKKSGRKQQPFFNGEGLEEETGILNQIYSYLVDPGPDLVICDEGHRIKNSGASISQALKAIRTRRRVVLTGYPLQNNLMEYWCMVDFIRPNYLGSKVEFSNMFERPISNGQCVDSTPEDRRLMKFRSHVLHSLLEGFVQRRSHAVLQLALPRKQEWVFLLKMTPIQYSLYKEFIKYLSENTDGQSAANPIKAFAVCCKIWNHPDALYNVVKKKQSILDDLDLDEINSSETPKGPRGRGAKRIQQESPAQISHFDGSGFSFPRGNYGSPGSSRSSENQALSLDWAVPLFKDYVPGIMENGVKFEILFEIIKESVEVGDKLLVFSQTLLSLDLTEIFLAQKFNWVKNYQYYRLDGSTTGLERERLINNFNSKPEIFVFLVSTRAGSLGINLTGANRVVVLDASWNPCHDCQAVCRIYRYGQKKPCQIYRFVSDCTLEKRIYDRQVNKRGMSDRVVDEMNPNAQFKTKDVSSFLVLQHDHLDKLPYITWDYDPEKYSDLVLQNVLSRLGNKLTQEPFEHESLLIDQKSQRLSATEKRLAHRHYLNEKRTASLQSSSGYTYNRPSYSAYYPKEPPQLAPRPYSSTQTNYQQFQTPEDKFEQHVPSLRQRGICVQSIILKKDSFLADPGGGPDMYIMAGEKVYVLRSMKGTYLRISNGKLIAVRNNPTNNRIPGMNIPSSVELTKEQLQGLVYSFLKLPGRGVYGSDSFRGPSGDQSAPYLPPEQPLPPSPSFFTQGKNHLQVTNSRNNSGGNVTVWPTSFGEYLAESLNNTDHSKSRTEGGSKNNDFSQENLVFNRSFGETHSSALGSNSFNPNLERLSYLANRFPEMHRSSGEFFDKLSSGQSSSPIGFNNPSRYISPSPSTYGSPKAGNGSTTDRAEVELIPIPKAKGSSNSSRSSSTAGDSFPRGRSRRPVPDGSSVQLFSETVPNPNLLNVNPSFYKDFTITVKSRGGGGGGESSASNSSCSNGPADSTYPSHSPAKCTGDSFKSRPWSEKLYGNEQNDFGKSRLATNTVTEGHHANGRNGSSTSEDLYPILDVNSYLAGLSQFNAFNPNQPQEEPFHSSPDFQDSSQYYSNNSSGIVNNNDSSLPRNDSMPVYFPNQGF